MKQLKKKYFQIFTTGYSKGYKKYERNRIWLYSAMVASRASATENESLSHRDRVPQPPGKTGWAPFRFLAIFRNGGFESLSHRECEPQAPFRFCGFESLSHREREPQPPGMRTAGTGTTVRAPFRFCGFESLSHQNHREWQPQPPFRLASRASATGNENRDLGYFKSL